MRYEPKRVKAWMLEVEISQAEVAREMEVSFSMMSSFIAAKSVSMRLFQYFLERGCPPRLLAGRPEARRAA